MFVEQVCGDRWGKIAAQIISDWKSNADGVCDKFGSLNSYANYKAAEALWEYEEIRAEFGNDIERLKAYLKNEPKVTVYGGGIETYSKEDF